MSRVPRSHSSLTKLIRAHPTLADTLKELGAKTDDRSVAIIKAEHVNFALETVLAFQWAIPVKDEEKIRELFVGDSAPLSSFSAKIKVCHAAHFFRENTRAELDRIRAIRNVFAHSRRPVDFSTQEIALVCEHLTTPERVTRPHFTRYENELPWPPINPRDRFVHSAELVAAALIVSTYDSEPDLRPRPVELPDLD